MALPEVLIDNLVNIVPVDIGIPRALGINNDNRPLLATVQASCRVNAYATFTIQTQRLDSFLGIIADVLRLMVGTTCFPSFALIHAEKNMITVIGHVGAVAKRE